MIDNIPTEEELFEQSPFNKELPTPLVFERSVCEPLVTSNAFTPEECQRIITEHSPKDWRASTVTTPGNGEDHQPAIRHSKSHLLEHTPKTEWFFQRCLALAIAANNKEYHFDIDYFEGVQLTRYDEGDFYVSHLDIGPGNSNNRKLSMTIQLSDPESYEGGELQIDFGRTEDLTASREIGSATVFPSFLRHHVTEVATGTRYSLVVWVSGSHRFK
jgi:PKHD-type hydroxylase